MHTMTLVLQKALADAADPVKAPQMQAYAKTEQPFYGVSAPIRKALSRKQKNNSLSRILVSIATW